MVWTSSQPRPERTLVATPKALAASASRLQTTTTGLNRGIRKGRGPHSRTPISPIGEADVLSDPHTGAAAKMTQHGCAGHPASPPRAAADWSS